MAINNLDDLAVALKGGAGLTLAEVKALDPVSPICQTPFISVQAIKSRGISMSVTTEADGSSRYHIDA